MNSLFSFSIPSLNEWRKYVNKFSLTLVMFLVWMMFFDNHDFRTQRNLKRIISELKTEKQKFSVLYLEAVEEKKILDSDQEKFAREKYYMHMDNEDVFIINKNKEE